MKKCMMLVVVAMSMCGYATVLEVNVPSGTVQTNFSDEVSTAIGKLTANDEIKKTGAGRLTITANYKAAISNFKGTIRIAEGMWVLAAPGESNVYPGPLGYAGQSTVIVEDGATLYFDKYTSVTTKNYSNIKIHIAGDGFNHQGAIVIGGRFEEEGDAYLVSNVTGWEVTLDADATIAMGPCNGNFNINAGVDTGCSLDMNGHTLMAKNNVGLGGFRAVANPGTVILETGDYSGTAKFPMVGNWGGCATNKLVVQAAVTKLNLPAPACTAWTICFEGTRSWNVGESTLANPIEIAEGAELTLRPAAACNGELWLDGAISGKGDLYVNNAEYGTGSRVYLGGDNTAYEGKITLVNGNKSDLRYGQFVYLSKKSIPNWDQPGVIVGFTPHAWDDTIHQDLYVYFAAKTDQRSDGWTSAELWQIIQDFKAADTEKNYGWGLGVYVDPDVDFILDGDFAENEDRHTQPVNALGGGRLLIRGDFRGTFRPFKPAPGVRNVVYTAKDPSTGSSFGAIQVMGDGQIAFENCGLTKTASYFAARGATRSDLVPHLVVGSGTVVDSNSCVFWAGAYQHGSRTVVELLEGGVLSNNVSVADNTSVQNQCGSYIQRGGAFRMKTGQTEAAELMKIGGGTNSYGYAEVNAGEFTGASTLAIGENYRTDGFAAFYLKGGTMDVAHILFGGHKDAVFRQTGGSLTLGTIVRIPSSESNSAFDGSNGFARVIFENEVRPSVPSGVVFCDRVASTGSVDLVSGAILETPSVTKAEKTSMWKRWDIVDSLGLVNFNGGGLCAVSNDVELLGLNKEAVDRAVVYAGGAILEAKSGVRARVSVPLVKPSGLGVSALSIPTETGTLDGYSAAPFVRIRGAGVGASAVAEFDSVSEKVTGVTVTSPGWDYTMGAVTAELTIGGCSTNVSLVVATAADAGTGGLTKRGAGTIALAAANTYGGQTVVEEGVLEITTAEALPAGSEVVLKGGTIEFGDPAWTPPELTLDPSVLSEDAGYVFLRVTSGTFETLPTVKNLPSGWKVRQEGNALVIKKEKGLILLFR